MFNEYNDPASETEEMEEKPSVWRCKECGFIHYGSEPPEFCPICGQPASRFEPIKSGKKKSFSNPYESKL
jgi:rubrerythrin